MNKVKFRIKRHQSTFNRIISAEYIEKKKSDIYSLDLSVRSCNCLLRAGIDSIEKLLNLNKKEFYQIQNLGEVTAKEIVNAVNENGYKMHPEIQYDYDGLMSPGITLYNITKHIPDNDKRHVVVMTFENNKPIWSGSAAELKRSNIIYDKWYVNEILVDRSEPDSIPEYERGKIVVVYR